MTLDYISGFFDADGSITLAKSAKTDAYKTIKIDFTNTYLSLLKEIQNYFITEHNIKLYLSKKAKKKENHMIGYTLFCSSNQKCLKLCRLLISHHPKKRHRINTVLKYHDAVTKKNRKYSPEEIKRKLAYERLFLKPVLS